jgi:uridine kinase
MENNSASPSRPFLVGICGGSASGKTSVARLIFKYIGIQDCLLFSMDNYYKGPTPEERKHLSDYNFDHPDALDLDLLSTHLQTLIENKPIAMPIYEFNGSYRKKETQTVYPNKLIIFEGILAFHDKRMRDMMDMKIFVDLDSDIRLSRRVYRDINDRGRGLDTIIERYHKFVKPAFDEFIYPTRKYADMIVPRGAENTLAVDLIAQYLKGLIDVNKDRKGTDVVNGVRKDDIEKLFVEE